MDGAAIVEFLAASIRIATPLLFGALGGLLSERAGTFAVGIEGANVQLLARIAVRPPVKLRKLCFAELFTWLSASIAGATPADDPVALPQFDRGTT